MRLRRQEEQPLRHDDLLAALRAQVEILVDPGKSMADQGQALKEIQRLLREG